MRSGLRYSDYFDALLSDKRGATMEFNALAVIAGDLRSVPQTYATCQMTANQSMRFAMSLSEDFITSSQALAIFRDVAKRPRASRASLKYWVDRGCIHIIKITSTCWMYSRGDIEIVAKRLGGGGAE